MPSNTEPHFTFRQLTEADIDAMMAIQEVVVDALVDPDMLALLSVDEGMYMLQGHGKMIGAFVSEALVAFRGVLEPPIDDEHLGIDVGLTEQELPHVLYQEVSMVLPMYRGHRLQQQLATRIMEMIEQSDKNYTHVCATVAPTNIPSLKDKFKQGMHTVRLKKTYGDKWRYVFSKPLQTTWKLNVSETTSADIQDLDAHIQLLESGWYGTELVQDGDTFSIIYHKRLDERV